MTSQRLGVAVMVVLLVLMLVSAYWLWGRLRDLEPATPFVPTPVETATPTMTPIPTTLRAPPGYRLAGVAVGEPQSFAVVESSSGSSALYRVGENVPGLGRLLSIGADRVIVENEAGQFDLRLAPAPTATPGRTLATATIPPAARKSESSKGRRPAVPAAGTTPESTP